MNQAYQALVLNKTGEGDVQARVQTRQWNELPSGDVTIQVAYSSLNYKDALACSPNGNIVKSYPFVPGVDLAGTVVDSTDARFVAGQRVLVTGYELGVSYDGGLSEYARVPADWVIPLPEELSCRDAMIFGTAGLTAALSIERLERHGVKPEDGPVLVTGASGGVGTFAVAMLAAGGYEVAAVSGKPQLADALRQLGAKEVMARTELLPERPRPLDKQRWAAAVDVCGGPILTAVLASLHYGGAVAASGLTAGSSLPATVYPFILRGITLYGIDSVYVDQARRSALWSRIATDWAHLVQLQRVNEIHLTEVAAVAARMLEGQTWGRTIVNIAGTKP
ncbi:oxidoreductase [Paenibacillus sp. 481]|uniref:oxidoreductase n=1 Tax=Paenibacillus sp. 481 TaxID=2835869 RepID=UPI001E5B30ED|nr:oxidoreductase [Paenibacillus sp. 481]UHA72586.1 oxidoreductase [Paenibacillus sp. 481]